MSTHLPRFQSFSAFLHHFVLTKLDTSSIRVNDKISSQYFEIEVPGGAIYLLFLVLDHTAWSKQKGMSTV